MLHDLPPRRRSPGAHVELIMEVGNPATVCGRTNVGAYWLDATLRGVARGGRMGAVDLQHEPDISAGESRWEGVGGDSELLMGPV